MMTNETKLKIEGTFETKDIKLFLEVLDKCSKEKIGIPDLRAYVQENKRVKTNKK